MSRSREPLGSLQRPVLEYIAERGSAPAREVTAHFEKTIGRARTTVLTVMERLHKKGYLKRRKTDGVLCYSTAVSRADLMKQIVSDFVQDVLGGRVSPFVAYLTKSRKLTSHEVRKLEQLLKRIETRERRSKR